jgi:hypothetical protein
MARDIKISLPRLLTGLIVVIVPLSVFGLYLTSSSDTNLRQAVGTQLKAFAQTDAMVTSQFIGDRVVDVRALADEPAVLEAIQAANRSYEHMSNEVITAHIEKIEQRWDTAGADPLVKEMLSSRASGWLQRQREVNPQLLKIIAVDDVGAAVAATDKPVHYSQKDKEYWDAIYAEGRGAVNVTDVRFDEPTRSNYIGIGVPVLERDTGRFIGAVSALVDISGLFSLLNQQQIGRSGRVLLIRRDGTVISAPNVTPALKLKSEEFAAVHDALGTLEGRQNGYVTAVMKNDNRLVGFAETSLAQTYHDLGWLIMVSQDQQEALAPVRPLGQFALLMVVLGLLMLTLLVVYFFLQQQQPFEQEEILQIREGSKGKGASA